MHCECIHRVVPPRGRGGEGDERGGGMRGWCDVRGVGKKGGDVRVSGERRKG